MEDDLHELTALTDGDVQKLLDAMRRVALATDQRILVSECLFERSLTCQQAGFLLEAVRLGLMQRMLVFEVFQGRLTDLPDGLPYVLEHLTGPIRRDAEACLMAPVGTRSPTRSFSSRSFLKLHGNYTNALVTSISQPVTAPMKPVASLQLDNYLSSLGPLKPDTDLSTVSRSPATDRRQPNWQESVDRLRRRVEQDQVSGPLYEDLNAVFEALGLGPLVAPTLPADGSRPQEWLRARGSGSSAGPRSAAEVEPAPPRYGTPPVPPRTSSPSPVLSRHCTTTAQLAGLGHQPESLSVSRGASDSEESV